MMPSSSNSKSSIVSESLSITSSVVKLLSLRVKGSQEGNDMGGGLHCGHVVDCGGCLSVRKIGLAKVVVLVHVGIVFGVRIGCSVSCVSGDGDFCHCFTWVRSSFAISSLEDIITAWSSIWWPRGSVDVIIGGCFRSI